MKLFIVALAFFAVASASLSHDQAWEEFKLQFKKGFRSMVDEANRKQIFLNNLEEVEKHNAKFDLGLSTYRQGINFYSDWTWEEFQNQLLLKPQPELAFVSIYNFPNLNNPQKRTRSTKLLTIKE